MKRKIQTQIISRENIAKKISDSFVDEREKSKEKLNEKMMSQTFEIKDVKYEGIRKKIKININNTWKNITLQKKTASGEFNKKYIEYKFNIYTVFLKIIL